jgi:hypothetical protein
MTLKNDYCRHQWHRQLFLFLRGFRSGDKHTFKPMSNTIEIFKTNISDRRHAAVVIQALQRACPGHTVNVDLEDCDKILRIKSFHPFLNMEAIFATLATLNIKAEILEDVAPCLRP